MEQSVYTVKDKLERTRYYMGGYWTFLATGNDTNGQFSLIEMNLRKGLEPPSHAHTYEDESFHVIEGSISYTVNGKEHLVHAGEFIHLPKGINHSFRLETEQAKVLAHIVPAGLEAMFMELSQPATQLDYPEAPAEPPPAAWLQKAQALQQKFGIMNLDNSKVKAS